MISILLSSTFVYSQNKTLDSLYRALKTTNNDSVKIDLHSSIAYQLANISLYEKAKSQYEELLKLSEATNHTKGKWSYWSGMASILLNENKLDEALESYLTLEKEMISADAEEVNLAVIHSSIANVYDAKSMYNNAVEYHTKALTTFRKVNNKPYEAIVLGNLASIYYKNKDYDNAILYHEQSLEIKREYSSDYSIGTGLFNLAQVYDRLEQNQKTIDILNESISYSIKANDQTGIALSYTSLGLCYVNLTKDSKEKNFELTGLDDKTILSKKELLDKAFTYEMRAIAIFDSLNENYQIGHTYNGVGTVLINQEKPREALDYYHHAYIQFKDTKLEIAKVATEGLAEGYKDLKQFDSAYYWQKELIQIKEKINKQTNPIELGRQQANLIYQQEKEIEQLQHDQLLFDTKLSFIQLENKLKSQRNNRNKWILILVLSIIVIIIVFYFTRKNLQTKNELLFSEKQQTALLSTIEGEEKERDRIAIELHDGIASEITGVRLKLASNEISSTELEKSLKNINSEIRTISHQLTSPKLDKLNNVQSFFEHLISISFTKQNVNLTCYPEGDIFEYSNQELLNIYRIIQELFQNITKHAKATEVDISYNREEQEINVIIEDNGQGFEVNNTKKGIGLDNIQKRLLPLNGELIIDSSLDRGTCIIINIKK